MREFYFSQVLPISVDEAWRFFSDPVNLREITPEYLDFKVTSSHHGNSIYGGQIIRYRIRPVLNIPVNWCTEITHVVENRYFVDEQRFGPYAFWHHQHHFTPTSEGVLMEDILHFSAPFGPIGWLAERLFVIAQVKGIFAYRKQVLNRLFGSVGSRN